MESVRSGHYNFTLMNAYEIVLALELRLSTQTLPGGRPITSNSFAYPQSRASIVVSAYWWRLVVASGDLFVNMGITEQTGRRCYMYGVLDLLIYHN